MEMQKGVVLTTGRRLGVVVSQKVLNPALVVVHARALCTPQNTEPEIKRAYIPLTNRAAWCYSQGTRYVILNKSRSRRWRIHEIRRIF